MSRFSSHCRMKGMVRGIFFSATALPSTLSTPVPDRPIPLMLLNASVAIPRQSYLKSNSSTCLPGASASGPSHLIRSRSTMFQEVQVADLLDPLRRRVMGRERAAGHVVDEERLIR